MDYSNSCSLVVKDVQLDNFLIRTLKDSLDYIDKSSSLYSCISEILHRFYFAPIKYISKVEKND